MTSEPPVNFNFNPSSDDCSACCIILIPVIGVKGCRVGLVDSRRFPDLEVGDRFKSLQRSEEQMDIG